MTQSTKSIAYMTIPGIANLVETGGEYKKLGNPTLLRLPSANEIGSKMTTYVKDGDTVRVEKADTDITADSAIARNPQCIGVLSGVDVYNEWPIGKETVKKNYGQEVLDQLTTEFQPFEKKASVKAVMVTKEILDLVPNDCVCEDGLSFRIKVDWSEEPMVAKCGDYITSGKYSISAHDMLSYTRIG